MDIFICVVFLSCPALALSSQENRRLGTCGKVTSNLTGGASPEMGRAEVAWSSLVTVAVDVFRILNKKGSSLNKNNQVVILYPESLVNQASKFALEISISFPGTQFLHFMISKEIWSSKELNQTTNILKNFKNDISTVIVFGENDTLFVGLFRNMSSADEFRWTAFQNTAEWLVVLGRCTALEKFPSMQMEMGMDFVTLIQWESQSSIKIAQKSRTQPFKIKAYAMINYTVDQSSRKERYPFFLTSDLDLTANITFQCCESLRPHSLSFLDGQLSVLSGMKIPVAVIADQERYFYAVRDGSNRTSFHGFSAAHLDMLATSLGFHYEYVELKEGGFYGEVRENGEVTGLTGKLARKEAALSTMPVSRLKNRIRVIDFVDAPFSAEIKYIIYRIPQKEEHLDTTYFYILDGELVLSLLGPLTAFAIVGLIVHVITGSCSTSLTPLQTKGYRRYMLSFPSHFCFWTDGVYKNHTGRILIATWGVFCLILGSACSAYLVTSFTIKPRELQIRTLDELLANPDYKFGIRENESGFITELRIFGNKSFKDVWTKLVHFNKTDPRTFSTNTSVHVNRLRNEKYVFLDGATVTSGAFFDHIGENLEDIRIYTLNVDRSLETSYVAMSKDLFFKDVLRNKGLEINEAGLIHKLQKIYFKQPLRSATTQVAEQQDPVRLRRIELLLYGTVCGVGISLICLIFEMVFHKFTK